MIIFALGMQRLMYMLVWLSRVNHCKGFGIQSPTDYSFVRYVINEHDPYYQYKDLEKVVKGLDSKTRKLCQLYFRLSNFCQSPFFVDVRPDTSAAATYVKAACGKTKVVMVDGSQQMMPESIASAFTMVCAMASYLPPFRYMSPAAAPQPALTAPQYADSLPIPVLRCVVTRLATVRARSSSSWLFPFSPA